jgi:hypothetical protein
MAKRIAGLLVVALGVSVTGRQAPTPTFKADVNAVVIDVRVVDAQGRFVGDLTKDDLQFFEDGKPQTITTFDHVNIPTDVATRHRAVRITPMGALRDE